MELVIWNNYLSHVKDTVQIAVLDPEEVDAAM